MAGGLDEVAWAESSAEPPLAAPPLEGDSETDVAVVGGGFTGCSAALHLAMAGASVTLLEAEEIGAGASGRNMGHVLAGLWLEPAQIVRRLGPDHGERLIAALDEAPRTVIALVERHGLACDPVAKGVVKGAHTPAGLRALEEHVRQWEARGARGLEMIGPGEAEAMTGVRGFHGALVDHRTAAVNPLAYVRGLARVAGLHGAHVHGRSRVRGILPEGGRWRLRTDHGTVLAGRVILATNTYTGEDLWPGLGRSTVPVGAFVYATDPLGDNVRRTVLPAGHPLYDTRPVMNYCRLDAQGRLLLGSLGRNPRFPAEDGRDWANRTLRRLFPHLEGTPWRRGWSGLLGFTPEHLPRLHEPAPGIHAVVGYNGRGLSQGTFWGKGLAAWALGAPAADLPLPVTKVRPIGARRLRMAWYETAFRAARWRGIS